MKQTSKRLQALVLVLAMCVSFLQIPSFATAHSGKPTARSAAIEADGSFTITKSCDAHPNASEETVSGKIIEKKVATGTSYVAVDKDGKDLSGNIAVSAVVTPVKCAQDATITYYITVDGKSFYSDKFVTAKATGKHAAITEQEAKMDFNALAAAVETEGTFKCVSNTATCKATGKATFKKYCAGCKNYVEAITVNSPIVDHQFIKDEKGKPKEFEEVIDAATCSKPGEAYHYIQCNDCGQKLYASGTMFTETAIVRATKFPIAPLPHTFEYKIALNNGYDFVTKTTKTDTDLFKVDSKCTVCAANKINKDDDLAKPVKVELVADKTVEPKFDCVAGSKTYKVTYEVTDYSKAEVNGVHPTKAVTEEVTVPYYNNYSHGHDRTDVYVPDEESIVKATCTKDGHYNLVNPCKVCGDKEVYATIKIPATGKHTAAAAKKENVVAATTKKGGSYDLVVRCADCGKVLSKTHKTTAKIVVKASYVTKVKNYSGKKAKVYLKKASSISGYQIQYATNKSYKSAKYVNTKATSKYLTKLSKNKKYYVRVRTYKVISGKVYYSSWSGSKTVTIKK